MKNDNASRVRNRSPVFDRPPSPYRPHSPFRPLWLCRRCGHPWPCAFARLALLSAYRADPVGLSIYMAAVLHEAVADLARLDPAEIDLAGFFSRFVGWTARR